MLNVDTKELRKLRSTIMISASLLSATLLSPCSFEQLVLLIVCPGEDGLGHGVGNIEGRLAFGVSEI